MTLGNMRELGVRACLTVGTKSGSRYSTRGSLAADDHYGGRKPSEDWFGNPIVEPSVASPAIFSRALRSVIRTCRRFRTLMIPRVVRLRNALLTAASVIPAYSPMCERSIGR